MRSPLTNYWYRLVLVKVAAGAKLNQGLQPSGTRVWHLADGAWEFCPRQMILEGLHVVP